MGLIVLPTCSISDAWSQTTIKIPSDQPTIQAGIDAAQNGDTVLVTPGTYHENIDFSGKAITVTSSAGAAQTIIDGGLTGPIVTFKSGESRAAVINGFTLQNGAPGIYIVESFPTITNNIINDNQNCGIDSEVSGPSVRNNTISNSHSGTATGQYCPISSGGMTILGQPGCESSECPVDHPGIPDVEVIGNIFERNTTRSGGGGMSLWDVDQPLIQNNIFRFNQTDEGGGAIQWVNDGAPIIVQNLMYKNVAYANATEVGNGLTGGAIDLLVPDGQYYLIGAKVINNVFFDNSSGNSTLPDQPGSQIYVAGFYKSLRLTNNIVLASSGNSAIYCDDTYEPGVSPLIDHNDVWNTAGPGFSGPCTTAEGQDGNLSVDPKLRNAASYDFHESAGSPTIDVGNNDAPDLPALDLDGNPRIQDATNIGHAIIDMGAYEYPGKSNLISTQTLLTINPNPANVGVLVTFNTEVSSTGAVLGGTVTFKDGSTSLGTANVGTGGLASFTTSTLFPGTHLITAVYSGTDSYAPSTSNTVELIVEGDLTTTALTAAPNPSTVGQSIAFNATVTSHTGTPSGAVNFLDGATALGMGNLDAKGKASFATSTLAPGTHSITAQYAGDQIYDISTSPAVSVVVNKGASAVTLSASPNPASAGTSVTFQAKVSGPAAVAGTVSFLDGSQQIGQASVGSSGLASYSKTSLAVGTHSITASYAGSSTLLPSVSPAVQEVIVPFTGDFTIAVLPTSTSVHQGFAAQEEVGVSATGGFNMVVQLSCAGLPAQTTCTFDPASIAGGNGTATIRIQTTAPHGKESNGQASNTFPWGKTGSVLAASLFFLFLPRRSRGRGAVLLLALGFFLIMNTFACGSNVSAEGGTPPGLYNISIVGTSDPTGQTLSHSAGVKFTVKPY